MVIMDRPEADGRNAAVQYYSPMTGFMVRALDEERRIDGLLEKWKQSSSKADRDKIQQNLRAALHAEFQARLAAHEKEIDQLEADVKRLREQLELRRQKQDDIVGFHMEQLLRQAQGLGWGTEPVHGSAAGRPKALRMPGSSSLTAGAGYLNGFGPSAPPHAANKSRDGATANELNPFQKTGENAAPAPGSSVRPPAGVGPLPTLPPAVEAPAEKLPESPIDIKRDQPPSAPIAP